jgi:hypothetical protein
MKEERYTKTGRKVVGHRDTENTILTENADWRRVEQLCELRIYKRKEDDWPGSGSAEDERGRRQL